MQHFQTKMSKTFVKNRNKIYKIINSQKQRGLVQVPCGGPFNIFGTLCKFPEFPNALADSLGWWAGMYQTTNSTYIIRAQDSSSRPKLWQIGYLYLMHFKKIPLPQIFFANPPTFQSQMHSCPHEASFIESV